MKEDKELGKGWDKVPKNSTQVKEKIVERLINLRKQTEDGAYNLKQAYFIQILETVWGNKAVDATQHYNDRLRLFGILLTQPQFRPMIQRLSDGVADRSSLDDPELSLKQLFMELALAFNNDDIELTLPDAAYDLDNVNSLDPNDNSRITIQRDGKSITYQYVLLI